jgi:hypothetical protein
MLQEMDQWMSHLGLSSRLERFRLVAVELQPESELTVASHLLYSSFY